MKKRDLKKVKSMCGRFTLYNKAKVKEKVNFDISPNYNIAPSNLILILIPKPVLFYWGLSPEWNDKPINLINARIETLREKPAFKKSKPCIIVSDGWFEWKKSKTKQKKPFYIHNNKKIIYFAGIYNSKGCAIITKEANRNLANIHHRQPLILGKNARKSWIEEFTIDNLELTETLESYRVGSYVNSPKNNNSKCIEPI